MKRIGALLCVCILLICFCSCTEQQKIDFDDDTYKNLNIIYYQGSRILKWEAVTNATSYSIYLNERIYDETNENQIKTGNLPDGFYTFEIETNTGHRDSLKVEIGSSGTAKTLETPILRNNSKKDKIEWYSIEGAEKYKVYFDNNIFYVSENYFSYKELPDGIHTVSIQAIPAKDSIYLTSGTSDTATLSPTKNYNGFILCGIIVGITILLIGSIIIYKKAKETIKNKIVYITAHLLRTQNKIINQYKKIYRCIKNKSFFKKQELVKKTEPPHSETKQSPQNNSGSSKTGKTVDYRTTNPKPYRCEDGDYVRSKAEREIDDFFYNNRIWHIYEAEYIRPSDGQKYYPDFYLPDYELYLEYFGLENEKYIQKRREKVKMFAADPNVHFEYLDHNDDANIKERLTELCKKYKIPLKK